MMMPTLKLLLPCVVAVAAATTISNDGSIILMGQNQDTTSTVVQEAVSEHAARLLIQQRMLPSHARTSDHSLTLTQPVLELLSKYGGNQYNLFQEPIVGEQQKLLVVVEGLVEDNSAIHPATPYTAMRVPQVSRDFVDSIFLDSLSDWKNCKYDSKSNEDLSKLQNCLYQHPTFIGNSKEPITQLLEENAVSSFEAWSNTAGNKEVLRVRFKQRLDTSPATHFLASLSSLFESAEQSILLVPQQQTVSSAGNAKSKSSHLQSRKVKDFKVSSAASKDYLSTLMPVCHSTNDTCMTSTRACSGHGVCYLKSAGVKDNDCYACKCNSQWGGPACQKIDISTQFFLLGTVSVLAVLAIAGAVGMLFKVGQEELPSVISAGVTSPKSSR